MGRGTAGTGILFFSFLLFHFSLSLSASPIAVTDRLRIFPEGEPVVLHLSADGPAPATLAPVRRGPSGDAPAGERAVEWKDGRATLDLGKLPRGYYEIQAGRSGLSPAIAGGDDRGQKAAPTAFVVTFDPAARPKVNPKSARIATDAAIAWLVKPEDFGAVAHSMALCGVSWVRDRLGWNAVEPEPGVFHWEAYDRAVDAEVRAGLQVDLVFHDTAVWARPPDKAHHAFPDDLRHAYDFGKALAAHCKGRVRSYEVWNEADIPAFAVETADRYAPFLKATSLGIKAGDADALVVMNAFALQSGPFGEALFDNDIGPYADAYNHHLYRPADQHPQVARWHRELAARFGLEGLPNWVTEAGIALPDAEGRLSETDRWKQADFVAKSYAHSLAADVDRHFFFIFPYYKEGLTDFGLLDRDLAPTPGIAAFATASYALGEAAPLGEGLAGEPEVTARFFDAGPWRAAALWREAGPREVALRTADPGLRALTVMGGEIPVKAEDGAVRVTVGPSPVYLLAKDLAPATRVGGGFRPRSAATDSTQTVSISRPPDVVLRLNLPRDLARFKENVYALAPGAEQKAEVEAWNFGTEAVKGTLRLECEGNAGGVSRPRSAGVMPEDRGREAAPTRFRVSPTDTPLEIPPRGRVKIPFVLHVPAAGKQVVHRVTARFLAAPRLQTPDQTPQTPSVSRLRVAFDPKRLTYPVKETLPLDPAKWTAKASPNGEARLSRGAPAADTGVSPLRAECVFAKPGDRWAYPEIAFDPPKDLSKFDAFRVRLRLVEEADGLRLRLQLEEPGGVRYFTVDGIQPEEGEETEWIIPFNELEHAHFSPADANGKLDPDKVMKILVGVNQHGDRSVFEILRLDAVDTREAEVRSK